MVRCKSMSVAPTPGARRLRISKRWKDVIAVARAAFPLLSCTALALAPPPALMTLVTQAAERRSIPPALGHAVATVESR